MGIYFILLIGSFLCIMLYRRYFPVLGIPCLSIDDDKSGKVVLDLRDYNIDVNHDQSDMRVPYAYLKRFIQEIPHGQLHVIANDRLELNLGVRYLKSKGYRVASYQLSSCPCKV